MNYVSSLSKLIVLAGSDGITAGSRSAAKQLSKLQRLRATGLIRCINAVCTRRRAERGDTRTQHSNALSNKLACKHCQRG